MDDYVGFYWTLPINWAGFRRLPPDAEAAAARSRTIRYQLHRVRRFVADTSGRLVKEIVFIEVSPDRGTQAVIGALEEARALCGARQASLVYVDFAEAFHWRRHPHLNAYLQKYEMAPVGLSPDPITIDGCRFDPVEHFEKSRERHKRKTQGFRQAALEELLALAALHRGAPGDYQAISEALNNKAVRTPTGRLWTPETVRKTLKRRGVAFGDVVPEPV
ncbi:hypothetical protein [Aureimonas ureilytica]|uniref:hypothetical protein n=1 Tax=Aureimonas ureilytica TaxID=401562 RepID=UPI0003758F99|nr:hypothetical protein [Aureimonas ureilytica]